MYNKNILQVAASNMFTTKKHKFTTKHLAPTWGTRQGDGLKGKGGSERTVSHRHFLLYTPVNLRNSNKAMFPLDLPFPTEVNLDHYLWILYFPHVYSLNMMMNIEIHFLACLTNTTKGLDGNNCYLTNYVILSNLNSNVTGQTAWLSLLLNWVMVGSLWWWLLVCDCIQVQKDKILG